MNHKVQIVDENNQLIKILDAKNGDLLHNLLVHEEGYHAPCGGNGTCKKCKIKIKNDVPYTLEETSEIGEEERKKGIHFACLLEVKGDLVVELKNSNYQIAKDIYEANEKVNPIVKRTSVSAVKLKESGMTDYAEALKKAAGIEKISLEVLKKLPWLIRYEAQEIGLIHDEKKILAVEEGLCEGYGIAIDIGTTTVVAYLYNLASGDFKDVLSDMNQQRNFGFDVISRIKHAHEAKGLEELHFAMIHQINKMTECLLERNHIKINQLDEMVMVGNTVMLHLLIGVNPKDIGAAPFTPIFTEAVYTNSSRLGLKTAEHCMAVLLPSIAAYVGADIISGMLAADLYKETQTVLFLDIGTNGEIALLHQGNLKCCATAAGPAFEGANISHGVGSVFGAINNISKKKGKLIFTTIQNQEPIGLCGSGLIDAIAYLLENEYVDETGYLEGEDLVQIEDVDAFEITKKTDGTGIYITQKDIREVQLAKGSIRAGIDTLLYESGISSQEVDKVYIAGGFGSYMNKESAITIGLLPKELSDKLVSVGNAAGKGAAKVLLNKRYLEESKVLKERCQYIELSNSTKFMDYYMESMSF